MTTSMMLATVSGSFHRFMSEISSAVQTLTELGVHVVSPADPRVVAAHGEFLFVASDRTRSVRLVQDRHLESIRASHFLWLVTPDGYVGASASLELGYAIALGVPIFAETLPGDVTLRQYVTRVPNVQAAVSRSIESRRCPERAGFAINPKDSIDEAHDVLSRMSSILSSPADSIDDAAAHKLLSSRRQLAGLFVEKS